jgi:hypothetical protein
MQMIENMEFHSIQIRVLQCTQCGAHEVEHLRADGTEWKPGVPAAFYPVGSGNGSTAEVAAPLSRDRA